MSFNKFETSETLQNETRKVFNNEEKENINNNFVRIDTGEGFVLVGEDLSTLDDVKSTYSEAKISDVIKNWKNYVVKIKGDGNCLFRSLSYCLYRKESCFTFIRNVVVYHVIKKWQFYEDYVIGNGELNNVHSKEDYEKYMSKKGTYGGFIELVAASRFFVININVFSNTGSIFINNVLDKAKPTFSLFYAGDGFHGHYDVISINITQEMWERRIKQIESISAGDKDKINCKNCGQVYWENGKLLKKCHHNEIQFKIPDLTPYKSELDKLFSNENLTESDYYRKSSVSTLMSLLKKVLLASGVCIINVGGQNYPIRLSKLGVGVPVDSKKHETE